MKTFRLQESKTTLLKKLLNNGNITEEQFHIADDFFKNHTAFEKEIDWNRGLNITWDELSSVIYKERNSKSQARKKIRKGLEGFTEGKDYLILEEGDSYVAYQPLTWEASRMIASHYVEPSKNEEGEVEDANWCTAYQKDKTYWDDHNEIEAFIYICGETVPSKKIAVSISKEDYDANDTEFLYSTGNLNFNIWDFYDNYDIIEEEELLEVVPNLYDLIKNAYKNWGKLNNSKSFKYNPETNRFDYEGSLSRGRLKEYVNTNGDGFTINFGKIKGKFDCSKLDLVSLKGAPTEVGGEFYCSNNKLTSLEGAPQIVGRDFECYYNNLTSLKGAPQKVGRNFDCSKLGLTSLEGAPQKVGGCFDCSENKLTSLEGAPQTVGGNFWCYKNQLTSLEGAPQEVGGWFDCHNNRITSLKGAPQIVSVGFDCSDNRLPSLEGAPQKVGGNFDCRWNQLTSLKGAPQEIGWTFDCRNNSNLHSLEGIGEVKGEIYKDF